MDLTERIVAHSHRFGDCGGTACGLGKATMPDEFLNIDPALIMQLVKAAGIEAGSDVLLEIERIAEEYALQRKSEPVKLGQVRKRLHECNVNLDKSLANLTAAGWWAHSQLAGFYRLKFRKLQDDIQAIQHLSMAIGELISQIPSKGGRPRLEARDMLFLELIKLFEQRSGQDFTYPDKREQFRGSDFVRKVATMIEPALSDKECHNRMVSARKLLKQFGDLLRKP